MSLTTERHAGAARDHYSYAHYASRDVAEGFDALRFSGPIGRYLLDCQQTLLADALAPVRGRTILDVGTGTGRAAIGLGEAGARVIGVDASLEMLRVARAKAAGASVDLRVGLADAHALPLAVAQRRRRRLSPGADARDRLAPVRRRAVPRREMARGRRFPVVDERRGAREPARRIAQSMGRQVEAYRVMAERDVAEVFRQHGFRVVIVRRQFVLPIAFHKAVGRLGVTHAIERLLAAVGLLRVAGSPVTMVAER